jgi:hypothetical protein
MKFGQLAVESAPVVLSEQEFFEKLSLEGSMANNIIEFFRDALPNITSKLKGYVTGLTFKNENLGAHSLDANYGAMEKNSLSSNFLRHRDTLVQVPEGFTGEFLPYVQELSDIGTSLYSQTNKLISEYRLVLASIISNPEQRTSLQDLTASHAHAAAAREELADRLKVFNNGNDTARSKLGIVLPRYAEAHTLATATKRLAALVEEPSLKKIQTLVRETVELLCLMEDSVKKRDMTAISEEVVKNVAQGAYSLAQYIDQVVVFYYAAISTVTCVELMFQDMSSLKE